MAIWAGALASHCLLEALHGGAGYRLHDLVLEYIVLTIQMRRHESLFLRGACSRQARFLSAPKVLHGYSVGGEIIAGGLYALVALWNALLELLEGCVGGTGLLSVAQCYAESLEAEKDSIVPWQEAGELLMLLVSERFRFRLPRLTRGSRHSNVWKGHCERPEGGGVKLEGEKSGALVPYGMSKLIFLLMCRAYLRNSLLA